jgi:hypothetical protein
VREVLREGDREPELVDVVLPRSSCEAELVAEVLPRSMKL